MFFQNGSAQVKTNLANSVVFLFLYQGFKRVQPLLVVFFPLGVPRVHSKGGDDL